MNLRSLETAEVFSDRFNLRQAVELTKDAGYYYSQFGLDDEINLALLDEIDSLPMTLNDRVSRPIRPGKPNQVTQLHENFYVSFGDNRTPVANFVVESINSAIHELSDFPELHGWSLSNIGYQRYQAGSGFISPHRDPKEDRKLGFTFTLSGSSLVRFFKSEGVRDYSELEPIDEVQTMPGTVMMLRANGLGSGQQVIHEVHPPDTTRSILNLRA